MSGGPKPRDVINPFTGISPTGPINMWAGEQIAQGIGNAASPESPGAPQGIAAPPSPTSEDPAAAKKAQEAADAAALSERKARGRASTILTGGKGVLGSATTSRRTLLGS